MFWQWCNQSFNALVNYTNRSGSSPIPVSTLVQSYVGATGGALFTALSLNHLAKKGPPLAGRLVPLAAVAAANCVNIPLMRITELREGIELQNDEGKKVGSSVLAAKRAIFSVTFSRILMASPSMGWYIFLLLNYAVHRVIFIMKFNDVSVLAPLLMNYLEKRNMLRRFPWAGGPIQVALCGVCLTFATPLCCALFAQRVAIPVTELEPEVQQQIKSKDPKTEIVFYNKGL